MKVLKTIGIALLVIIVLILVISVFLPSKVHVERSLVINAPVKTVFNAVNNLKLWINWSYWDRLDPNMQSTFEGPESGVGAVHKWSSDHEKVGTGSKTITESVEPSKVLTSLTIGDMPPVPCGWLFDDTGEGVNAKVYLDMDMPFYARMMGLFMDNMLGKDFEKTLNGLKEYTESLPAEPAAAWMVDTLTTTPAQVMSMRIVSNQREFSSKMMSAHEQIMKEMTKQNLKQTGPTYAMYYKWTPDTVEMETGFIVESAGKSEGTVLASELKPVRAAKVDYYGDYSGIGKAHEYMDEWVKKNNVMVVGAPWEEYAIDPKSEPDTGKWLTRIYYPIR